MLTSSPLAPSRSTSASPRGFHYAPTRPSPQGSPKVTAPLPRRLSRRSVPGSPSLVKQYVGVDRGTSYSPMEPFDPTVPLRSSAPTSMAAATATAAPGQLIAASSSAIPPQSIDKSLPVKAETAQPLASTNLSPTKRRNSTELERGPASTGNLVSATATAATTTAIAGPSSAVTQSQSTTSPKRARPAEGPPKVLPLRYELCDVEDMVVLVANMLNELIETNDSIAMKSGHLTRFHSRTAPGISVVDYLHRLAKHATLTPPLLLCMVYYIDRLCALYPDFTINTLTVHRFLITAATVAGKGLSDSFWNNTFYARVGGVKVAELKLLELEFLYRVDWKIIPNPEVLVAYYKGLVERCKGYVLEEESSAGHEEEDDGDDDSDDIDDDIISDES